MRPFLLEFDVKRNNLIYRQITLDFQCSFKCFIEIAMRVNRTCKDFLIIKIISITEFPIIGISV